MKKFVTFITIICLAISLAACGEKESGQTEDADINMKQSAMQRLRKIERNAALYGRIFTTKIAASMSMTLPYL